MQWSYRPFQLVWLVIDIPYRWRSCSRPDGTLIIGYRCRKTSEQTHFGYACLFSFKSSSYVIINGHRAGRPRLLGTMSLIPTATLELGLYQAFSNRSNYRTSQKGFSTNEESCLFRSASTRDEHMMGARVRFLQRTRRHLETTLITSLLGHRLPRREFQLDTLKPLTRY